MLDTKDSRKEFVKMKWFYKWRYHRNARKSLKYQGGNEQFPNGTKYETLFKIHIEKMRFYATKLGWME
jgi:hypothetical protein